MAQDKYLTSQSLLSRIAPRTLSQSAYILFCSISLISASCAASDYIFMRQEKAAAIVEADLKAKNGDLYAQLVGLQKQIAFDVVQVQQFLSDYSATRGLDGQDDGLENAAKFAAQLKTDVDAAVEAAKRYESTKLADSFAEVGKRFPQYYASGVQMAKTYAAEGPTAGNKIMRGFDRLSDEMQEKLEATGAELRATKEMHNREAAVESAKIERFRELTVSVGLASIVIITMTCVAAVVIVRRFIVRPLAKITVTIKALAHGDTSHQAQSLKRSDEIGDLARAYAELRRIVLAAEEARAGEQRQATQLETERRQRELQKREEEVLKTEALRRMIDTVENETKEAVHTVIAMMAEMVRSTADLSGVAERLSDSGASVSSASSEAKRKMESAAASTKQLTAAIDQVADQARSAQNISDQAVTASRRASDTMAVLSRVTTEINEVTGLISDIARQTGLLALNAGVEAARAGSEGRGFAVIAQEVRSLADQTSAATSRVGGLIEQIQESSKGALAAMAEISRAIDRVNLATTEITRSVKAQVETTAVIASNVSETTAAVSDVSQQMHKVAQESDNANGMARSVDTVSVDVMDNLRELQKSLVKIVRTCSSEVNRRKSERIIVNLAGRIEFRGASRAVDIIDLSEGGALLQGQIDEKLDSFNLILPMVDAALPCEVVHRSEDGVHVSFKMSSEARDRFVQKFEALASPRERASLARVA